jgi:hypothetical protein
MKKKGEKKDKDIEMGKKHGYNLAMFLFRFCNSLYN